MTLTRKESVALWHAVRAFADMVAVLPEVEGVTPAQIESEKQRLATAKAALRKVQAMRRLAS